MVTLFKKNVLFFEKGFADGIEFFFLFFGAEVC